MLCAAFEGGCVQQWHWLLLVSISAIIWDELAKLMIPTVDYAKMAKSLRYEP